MKPRLSITAALLLAAVSSHGQSVSTVSGATGLTKASAPASVATPSALPTIATLAALDCMIQPNQVVQVGSPAPGVIDEIVVDRGQVVRKGQPVVQLNAVVERASLAVARERAGQRGDATVASSSRVLALRELQRAQTLHQQDFVSQTYLDKLRAEAGVANGRSHQADERKTLAVREAELAAAQLEQRTVRAPISGVVLERLMSPGEFVDQKPMLRLASIDPLRVDVLVPAAAFGQINPGMSGQVMPELISRSIHVATVTTVDRVIDAASNTFRVRLELPNPGNQLPAGLRCKVNLANAATPPAAKPAARPADPEAASAAKVGANSALAATAPPKPLRPELAAAAAAAQPLKPAPAAHPH